jgi:Thiamine pyrophosphate enzyme, C-terminal TPP binding domain
VVLMLGDGAAGLSLMDVDTLVRHNLPVVMIVGNNSAWGLEKEPMRAVYGYDVAADLRPETRYDQVVRALGGAGELVTAAKQLAPAMQRAVNSAAPYLINVITDVDAAYPRTTTGVLADLRDQVVFLYDVTLGHVQLGDRARILGEDGDLHLHRLEDDERVAVVDMVALGNEHLPHVRDHLRADFRHS